MTWRAAFVASLSGLRRPANWGRSPFRWTRRSLRQTAAHATCLVDRAINMDGFSGRPSNPYHRRPRPRHYRSTDRISGHEVRLKRLLAACVADPFPGEGGVLIAGHVLAARGSTRHRAIAGLLIIGGSISINGDVLRAMRAFGIGSGNMPERTRLPAGARAKPMNWRKRDGRKMSSSLQAAAAHSAPATAMTHWLSHCHATPDGRRTEDERSQHRRQR